MFRASTRASESAGVRPAYSVAARSRLSASRLSRGDVRPYARA